jgi:hypothetical protein
MSGKSLGAPVDATPLSAIRVIVFEKGQAELIGPSAAETRGGVSLLPTDAELFHRTNPEPRSCPRCASPTANRRFSISQQNQ